MGCACKNKIKSIEKYSEDNKDIQEDINIIMKVLQLCFQMFFGIFIGVIIVLVTIPLLIYIIGCIMLGKQPTVMLKRKNLFFFKK